MAVPTAKEIMDFSPFNTGGKEEVPPFRRRLYSGLKEPTRHYIVALSGMRRVGKTTLLKQILSESGGAYFSFDEQRYQNAESLSQVLQVLLGEGFSTIVLDEIGGVQGWGGTLKKHYDRKKAKFYVSGSSSLGIRKGNESLAGRMFEYYLPPFQFDEYLEKNGWRQKERLWNMQQMPEELPAFLSAGSFPEIHGESPAVARKYIETLADKVVYEDIPSRFGVEHRSKLSELLRYCASFSASMFSESQVANALGISRGTVSEYLSHLHQCYMCTVVLEEGSYARALQKSKKLFVSSPSLYWALADSYSEGAASEVAVFDRLVAWGKQPKFFRDYQKREVDFIVDGIPLEVKNRSFIGNADFEPLLHFMKKKKGDFGIMVTRDRFDLKKMEGASILQVPLSVFLSCGNFETLLHP